MSIPERYVQYLSILAHSPPEILEAQLCSLFIRMLYVLIISLPTQFVLLLSSHILCNSRNFMKGDLYFFTNWSSCGTCSHFCVLMPIPEQYIMYNALIFSHTPPWNSRSSVLFFVTIIRHTYLLLCQSTQFVLYSYPVTYCATVEAVGRESCTFSRWDFSCRCSSGTCSHFCLLMSVPCWIQWSSQRALFVTRVHDGMVCHYADFKEGKPAMLHQCEMSQKSFTFLPRFLHVLVM